MDEVLAKNSDSELLEIEMLAEFVAEGAMMMIRLASTLHFEQFPLARPTDLG